MVQPENEVLNYGGPRLRRSCCITNEVLRENWRRNPENGVMHRARVGVYSGMLRVRMRQSNLGLGCGGCVKLVVTCGYGVATGARNYYEAEEEVLAERNK